MSSGYRNIHGRRWGRGLRPYLLLPKVLAVAAYLGGLGAMLVLCVPLPADTEAAIAVGRSLERLHERLLLPAFVVIAICGVGLVAVHGAILLRMRWLQVKLALLILVGPWLHYALAGAVHRTQHRLSPRYTELMALGEARLWVAALIVLIACIVWLGRHKPRLGQNIATVYQQRAIRRAAATQSPTDAG
jgi:hypothetical protein